jgi:hypothetical protein
VRCEAGWDEHHSADVSAESAGGGLKEVAMSEWQPMESAPVDRQILVRRHNDCLYEYFVVWHSDWEDQYPWRNDWTAFPTDRLDEWTEIPA